MEKEGTTWGPEVLLPIDRDSPRPLGSQLEGALRDGIRSGRLTPGLRLPSTRVLASDLAVSRRLVVDVYQQLLAEGYLVTTQGSGTRVATVDRPAPARAPAAPPPPTRYDFQPGIPELGRFPRQAWSKALRRQVRSVADADLDYPAPAGHPRLRATLANYLWRVRRVAAEPARIIVCAGFTQALNLLCWALRDRGARRVAIEDPGLPHRAAIIARAGLESVPVPVDDRGVIVERLVATEADAVVVTPAHQFPTGVVLAHQRREELLAWARGGRLIIEDDYDAEFRYDRAAIGALQGLAPENVAYVGTTTKTLSPALRLGWIAAPEHLVEPLAGQRFLTDRGSSNLDQLALADLIESSAYDRHLRQVRRRYRTRRDALAAAASRHGDLLRLTGIAAGIQVLAVLPDRVDAEEIVRRALEQGIRVDALPRFRHDPTQGQPGLLIGYGNVDESRIAKGIDALARIVAEVALLSRR